MSSDISRNALDLEKSSIFRSFEGHQNFENMYKKKIFALKGFEVSSIFFFQFYFVIKLISNNFGSPDGSGSKVSACIAETWVGSLGWEDPLEEEMTLHSSTLA